MTTIRVYATDEQTSRRMKRVRSSDTTPEMVVRRVLTRLGYRYRLHRTDLPGQPDLVFPSRRKVILVHGCFWHRHRRCRKSSMPKKNVSLWAEKFERTVARDRRNLKLLRDRGWGVLVLWECLIAETEQLAEELSTFLES